MEEWRPSEVSEEESTRFETMLGRPDERSLGMSFKTELGEGTYEMAARILPSFCQLLASEGLIRVEEGYACDHLLEERTLALVAHGGSLNVVARHLLGLPPSPRPLIAIRHADILPFTFQRIGQLWYPLLTSGY